MAIENWLGLGCGAGGWTGGEDPEGLGFVGGVVRDWGRAGELRGVGGEWCCEGLRKVWEEKGGRWVEVRTWGTWARRRWGSSSWVIAEWLKAREGDLGGEGRWPALPGLCNLSGENLKRGAWGHTGDSMGKYEGPVLSRE